MQTTSNHLWQKIDGIWKDLGLRVGINGKETLVGDRPPKVSDGKNGDSW
ncbi:MAG: hypothetical protein HRU07_06615 [Nitrosopumilus sp.]|nr:hypothetical protein [Nitrosopumilus sp.]NRA05813.1 hypothetical protein [Nitrosopumilus sp.]